MVSEDVLGIDPGTGRWHLRTLTLLTVTRCLPTRKSSPLNATAAVADRLEGLWILNVALFLAGAAYFVISGFAPNISSLVMLFTILAAVLHSTPVRLPPL